MNLAIFTDLDGTLLNHADYSFAEATPCLSRIAAVGIPLVLVTSKTKAEVKHLQRHIGIEGPFIVENGGGIFLPKRWGLNVPGSRVEGPFLVIRLGATYAKVRNFVKKAQRRFGLRGFGDFAPEEVSALTGLPLELAKLAKKREFSEPLLLERQIDFPLLLQCAQSEGLTITKGGRFHHLIACGQNKGAAVRIVVQALGNMTSSRLKSIGLGDSENDLPLLESVDIPILIRREDGSYAEASLPNLIRSEKAGSRGWKEAVDRLLDEFDLPGSCRKESP